LNTQATTIDVPSLGPVLFTASSKAKYLSITIKPDRTIRVAIPQGVSLAAAMKFLKSKTPWAKRHLDTLQMLQQNRAQGSLPALGTTSPGSVLSARLNQLAGKYGFTYNRLFIRNQRTRWGTCSSRNNISLNINLLKLPQELQDYVMLHELAHTKHKNHSREFWAEMDKLARRGGLVGDAKKLRKQMRNYKL
jgi:predicted metal-dependent hydrolase